MKLHKTSKGALVCFVGVDGAGKSTLAKLLIADSQTHGVEFRYLWMGFNSSFVLFKPLIEVLKWTVFRGGRYMVESQTKGRVLKNSRLSAVYQYLALTDYILQTFARLWVPLALGRNVVCDRYIYDLVASISTILDYPLDRTLSLLDRCLALLPKPDVVFLIDLPESIAYQRKDDIISPESLAVRRSTYLEMARQHTMVILDGSSEARQLAALVEARVWQQVTAQP